MFKSFLLTAAISSICLLTGPAQAKSTSDISAEMKDKIAGDQDLIRTFTRIENQLAKNQKSDALQLLMRNLFAISPIGRLSAQDLEQYESIQIASQRSRLISRILAWDLNADGTITQAEREAFTGRQAADLELTFGLADTNADDALSFPEILNYTKTKIKTGRRNVNNRSLLLFDLDEDGFTTAPEIIDIINALEDAPMNLRKTRIKRKIPNAFGKLQATCTAPKPAQNAQLVVLTGYEGAALSTISVAGMNDVTHAAQLHIEAGTKPIYLVLASHTKTIWEFSGATDRIQQLVVQKSRVHEGGGAGVVGIPKNRIHFVEQNSCVDAVSKVDDGKGIMAYQKAQRELSRAPDQMLAFYTINTLALPSGKGGKQSSGGTDILVLNGKRYELTPEGPKLLDQPNGQGPTGGPFGSSNTMQNLKRFHPAGIRKFDVDKVISPKPAQAYDVLPQEAGLMQLMVEDKIRVNGRGYYLIAKPIARYPAGLAGGHSVKFLLGEDVPVPAGSPGHSSVYSIGEGKCLTNRCR
ncbi:hypothetical protein [Amylibacter sp. IMCC11727]|uniref:EF-hand domain-containing protein n=1 Tax=Amylibacter sp. IMCC11727 TaxID=3039851 RepID=UPI00244DCCC2|nr:hypothetical protein [Amylibacter sp. IMCC11727]WGI21070.1 hypothetical protein QBD29_13265 [Amylibacter sp. IMCC11727]